MVSYDDSYRSDLPADLAVVGAGAAGLATAIFTARQHPDWRVVALDGARKLGAKILISGGGRCNVTNTVVVPADFHGGSPHSIRRILGAFSVEQTVAFFHDIGVPLHEEADGKLFPDSNRARTVLDALVAEAARGRVRILTEHRVFDVARAAEGFRIDTSAGRYAAKRVALATGGLSVSKTGSDGTGYRLAQQLGHSLSPTTPALVPLVLDGDFHAPLSGVAQQVALTLRSTSLGPVRVRGSLLWTHFGCSGPAVLDLSRFWHQAQLHEEAATIRLSFLPDADFAEADRRLLELAANQPRSAVANALATWLPARVAAALVDRLGIARQTTMAQLPREARRRLVHALSEFELPVRASRGYGYAEVTAGGVPLDEVDPATMESRRSPGLYLVGEILDVDGRIGGFNFQWAWSSAWVAARGME